MAIITGLTGGISGKMGNAVFRQRYGETVLTQYQPHVTNPNTDGQIVQRARFKLVSQLAAVLGDYVAIPRKGSVSGRNSFTRLNLPAVRADVVNGNVEKVTLDPLAVTLTDSQKTAPIITECVINGNNGTISLAGSGTLSVTVRPERTRGRAINVVVVEIAKNNPAVPRVVGQEVVTDFSNNAFVASIPVEGFSPSSTYAVYAYESASLSSGSSEFFENLAAVDARGDGVSYFVELESRTNFSNVVMSATAAVYAVD